MSRSVARSPKSSIVRPGTNQRSHTAVHVPFLGGERTSPFPAPAPSMVISLGEYNPKRRRHFGATQRKGHGRRLEMYNDGNIDQVQLSISAAEDHRPRNPNSPATCVRSVPRGMKRRTEVTLKTDEIFGTSSVNHQYHSISLLKPGDLPS